MALLNSFVPSFFMLKIVSQRSLGDASFAQSTSVNEISLEPTVWSWYKEKVGIWGNNSFMEPVLLEQVNTTKDTSDFLWYSTR